MLNEPALTAVEDRQTAQQVIDRQYDNHLILDHRQRERLARQVCAPLLASRGGIEGNDVAFGRSNDHQALSDSGARGQLEIEFGTPGRFARFGIERDHVAVTARRVDAIAVPHRTQRDAQKLSVATNLGAPDLPDVELRFYLDQFERFQLGIVVISTEDTAGRQRQRSAGHRNNAHCRGHSAAPASSPSSLTATGKSASFICTSARSIVGTCDESASALR